MKILQLRYTLLLLCGLISSLSVSAQIRLHVEGDAFIRGKIDLTASLDDTTSLFIGAGAGVNDDGTQNQNTLIGVNAGHGIGTGYGNTVLGYKALTMANSSIFNVAVGQFAMQNAMGGQDNIAIGRYALNSNEAGGAWNIAIGTGALQNNTSAKRNVAVGASALQSTTTGGANTAIGYSTLETNYTGEYNSAFGWLALSDNTHGDNNVAAGFNSLGSNTIGNFNVASGYFAMYTNTTGEYNVGLGHQADVNSANYQYAAAIGSGAIVNGSHKMKLGSSTSIIDNSNGYLITSDGRFKTDVQEDLNGLDFIMQLRPVTYRFEYEKFEDFLRAPMKKATAEQETEKSEEDHLRDEAAAQAYRALLREKAQQRQVGFIAQEVESAIEETETPFNGLYKPQSDKDNYAIDYGRLTVPLVKAVQEQQEEIESQDARVKNQEEELKTLRLKNEELESRLAKLEVLLQQQTMTFIDQASSKSSITPSAALGQNRPNPFEGQTIIPFFIPQQVQQAELHLTNSAGKTVQVHVITDRGTGQLSMETNTLPSGSYFYTLILDGKLLQTKQMVVAQ